MSDPVDPEWRETVREIYDELIYRNGYSPVARKIVRLIEDRHSAYFGAKRVTDTDRPGGQK